MSTVLYLDPYVVFGLMEIVLFQLKKNVTAVIDILWNHDIVT